jgi:hypothetical protein
VLAHLAVLGWVSWFAINRAIGAKTDAYDAADTLAILVMAGLVEANEDWQAPHRATAAAIALFLAGSTSRHLSGKLDWTDAVLGPILHGLDAAADAGSRGWVQAGEFRPALDVWRAGGLTTGRAYSGSATPPVDAEETFESDEWNVLFGAKDQTSDDS